MGDMVLYERDGHVATITYNRPEALNAINADLRHDLNAAWHQFRDDEEAWVGNRDGRGPRVQRGGGPARSSGDVLGNVLGDAERELARERSGDLEAGDRSGERLLPGGSR